MSIMNDSRFASNLALIGFMGAGKSAVGRQAARLLDFELVDTDQLIEARAGKTISEIFRDSGEAAFRSLERQVVAELPARRGIVIATGGGLPVNPDNLASLKTHALVICLWASPELIYERVRAHSHRPLLREPDPLAKIRQLLAAREPYYKAADVLVNTEHRSLKEVAAQVVHHFQMTQAAQR